jgi:hypothetical protein
MNPCTTNSTLFEPITRKITESAHQLAVEVPCAVRNMCEKIQTLWQRVYIAALSCYTFLHSLLFSPITITEINSKEQEKAFQTRVASLEKKADYPLGANERFHIDHGSDYFAFFKRLGNLHYLAACDNEKVVAVGAGILRHIPIKQESQPQNVWYLCDLKVDPDYRGKHIPMQMFMRSAYKALSCSIGYAISMNPKEGENRIARLFKNHSWIPVDTPKTLFIFSLTAHQITRILPVLEKYRGPVSFLSLCGKKDLILQSTQAPLPLLHAQFGPCQDPSPTHKLPQEGYTHMFCVPENDPLCEDLKQADIASTASASIISRGMQESDWKFILTSDI